MKKILIILRSMLPVVIPCGSPPDHSQRGSSCSSESSRAGRSNCPSPQESMVVSYCYVRNLCVHEGITEKENKGYVVFK
jgi:hypothetical protein